MEKPKSNNEKSILTLVCLIFSCLSWPLLSINNLVSLKNLYKYEFRSIWNIYIPTQSIKNPPFKSEIIIGLPIQMDQKLIFIVFNIYIAISFIGCAVFLIKILFKKDLQIIQGMMGKYSRFHFIPLLCAFVMSLLGELIDLKKNNSDDIAYTGLVFSLFGLISMIFIYIMSESKSKDWWAEYCLKKGVFSLLIILFWYNFCYDIYLVRIFNKKTLNDDKWRRGCNLAFSALFGIPALTFSHKFKDIMMCFINLLIYLGTTLNYFGKVIPNAQDKKEYKRRVIVGLLDLLIFVNSLLLFFYLLVDKKKTELSLVNNNALALSNVQKQTIVKVNANTEQINFLSSNIMLTSKM